MASRVSLPVWPTSLNCLSWSKDDFIAVGGGDQIAILTPRLKEPGPDGTLWDSTILKVNAFTAEEVPQESLLSYKNFSPGEELSLRHVHALEWSPPGLSKYGGCVLAVLSSNHVLSIWECEGKPDFSADWRRRAIINHAIRRHYKRPYRSEDGTNHDLRERKQVEQRVRAFAWSPPFYEERVGDGHDGFRYIEDGQHFMAVSTEAADILLLRLRSPHDILHPHNTEWNIEVVYTFNIGRLSFHVLTPNLNDGEGERHPCSKDVSIADHLAWGEWSSNHAHLAYISNGRLFGVRVEHSPHTESLEIRIENINEKHFVHSRSDMTGPLKFVPKTNLAIACAADAVYCVDTAANPIEDNSYTFHHLDGRWDEVSGIAFSEDGTELPRLHITSHLSSATTATTTLSLPMESDATSNTPCWKDAINDSKATFGDQWNLDGHVQERVWGIAACPLGNYIATATTLLPSNSVAYLQPSDQQTQIILNITREGTLGQDEIFPLSGTTGFESDITTETRLFNLRRYISRQSSPVDKEALLQGMLKSFGTLRPLYELKTEYSLSADVLEPAYILRYLRYQMFMDAGLMQERLKHLIAFAEGAPSEVGQISRRVIPVLLRGFQALPNRFKQGGARSKKIRKIYDMLQSKLGLELPAADSEAAGESWSEQCSICQKDIPFESVKWARCEHGHQFSRCGLTFLTIQKPGTSKYCNVCETLFLNEYALPDLTALPKDDVEMTDLPDGDETIRADVPSHDAFSPQDQSASEGGRVRVSRDSTAEPAASLCRTIFTAFHICIYCGGKFVA